jgi:tetratricopeptide (TPR) repeat protein
MPSIRTLTLTGVVSALFLTLPVLGSTVVAPDPSNTFTGAFLSAQVAEENNDSAAMIAYYKQSLTFDPSNTELERKLLFALLSDGKFQDALPYATKLKSDPISVMVLSIDKAIKQDWKASQSPLVIKTKNDLDTLLVSLLSSWTTLGAGDLKQAVQSLTDLKGPAWYAVFVQIHTAYLYDTGKDKPAALKAYELAAKSTEVNVAPEAWLRMMESYARFLNQDKQNPAALKVLERALEIVPERPSLLALKKSISAGETVEPMLKSATDGIAEMLFGLGVAIKREETEDYSRILLELALTLRPQHDITLIQLASISEATGQPEKAIEKYDLIPNSSPFKRGTELQAGLNLADLKKTDDAIAKIKALIPFDPFDTRAYLALGGIYSSNKNFKAAAEIYDKAVSAIGMADKNDWNLFYQRGIAHERIKSWPIAEASFKQALELFPNQPQVLNYLGYSWVDRRENLEQALDMIRKAVELRPEDGYIVDSLGWAYYRLGRFEEAVVELENAISLQPEDATINDHLGDTYWKVGRKIEARFQWQHALDSKSDDIDAKAIAIKLTAIEPKIAFSNSPVGNNSTD